MVMRDEGSLMTEGEGSVITGARGIACKPELEFGAELVLDSFYCIP